MAVPRVAIVGAGMGGLACAARLSAAGCAVTLLESALSIGGKLRTLVVGGRRIDSGPTVLTMRWVFEELFEACGATLSDALTLHPLATLARHAWLDGSQLDLFADRARTEDVIAAFASPAEARGYRAFSKRARQTYEALEHSFIRADRPTPIGLAFAAGLPGLARISPFTTYWRALSDHFADPRLRQLFARYATYCGADPFQAPATLMLVAHVEQEGVWTVAGGMQCLGSAVLALAQSHGATLRTDAQVTEILSTAGRANGVALATGERLDADAVVLNADAAALTAGLFGSSAARAAKTDPTRSLSALTFSILGGPTGFPLLHHSVFFSDDYRREFTRIGQGKLPDRPTVYICAADRTDRATADSKPERLFCIVNAPASDDTQPASTDPTAGAALLHGTLAKYGLTLDAQETHITAPGDFAALFPATGGALYGPATHGPFASFRRPGARTALPGLYLAGGSVHPGPGMPMAALSGHRAAASLLYDLPRR
jgi:1-hydroxycarotenoid 3,4-desaturase